MSSSSSLTPSSAVRAGTPLSVFILSATLYSGYLTWKHFHADIVVDRTLFKSVEFYHKLSTSMEKVISQVFGAAPPRRPHLLQRGWNWMETQADIYQAYFSLKTDWNELNVDSTGEVDTAGTRLTKHGWPTPNHLLHITATLFVSLTTRKALLWLANAR